MAANLFRPSVLLADRDHDADSVKARDALPVVPIRKLHTRRSHLIGYYLMRSLVERCFNKLKNARPVAARFDETSEGSRASSTSPWCTFGLSLRHDLGSKG